MKIFLDDLRESPDQSWTVVRTPADFKQVIAAAASQNSSIGAISFDNDLAQEEEGYDLLKWLAENYPEYLMGETAVSVHSANPEARRNIEGYVKSCREHAQDLFERKNRPYPFGEIEK